MKIIYICTGNVFRSMSAEYLSKKYIEDHQIKNIFVSSAGTEARFEPAFLQTIERLAFYGCDASNHRQTKISSEVLGDQDIIICMTEHHRSCVRELGFDSVLFNEIAYGKTEDILDDTEYVKQHGPDLGMEKYMIAVIDYIHEAIPFVIGNIVKK